MKITKTVLVAMINETLKNALVASDYDPTGTTREKPEEKKARREGKNQAVAKLSGKSAAELQQVYLRLEQQAELAYQDTLKHAFLWGALDQIKQMLKRAGEGLPRKSQDPWQR